MPASEPERKSLFTPCATVFISSFVLLVLELVAGRLIARFLGSSLYTWTSVIGIVLGGLTIGNYLGGRLADRYGGAKTLSLLFLCASISCIAIIVANNLIGNAIFMIFLAWPIRVFLHVAFTFFVPSLVLGMISPVVAKLALDRGYATGRTIGAVYAWGAAGSIAGTFATGYLLIAVMGTIAIVWSSAAVLLLMSLLYGIRLLPVRLYFPLFIVLLLIVAGPWPWAQKTSAALALTIPTLPTVLYEDETPYCYVQVRTSSTQPHVREFVQDVLMHSLINMNDITDLLYGYPDAYAALTHAGAGDREQLTVLAIGGGGYVFPRYLEHCWPQSRIDVAEIDPGVTKAAQEAFGLPPNSNINTISLDARNYVDQLIAREQRGDPVVRYDFIYGDAFGGTSVPFQLTTKEFNDSLFKLLKPDGVYMLNLIDTVADARFLAVVVNTIEQTFPHVYVLPGRQNFLSFHTVFVIVAAKHPLDLRAVFRRHRPQAKIDLMDRAARQRLNRIAGGMVLSDDYAPVENLLAPFARVLHFDTMAGVFLARADNHAKAGRANEALADYERVLHISPDVGPAIYLRIADVLIAQNRTDLAIGALSQAIALSEQTDLAYDVSSAYYKLGIFLRRRGHQDEARRHFRRAGDFLENRLRTNIERGSDHLYLARVLTRLDRPAEALAHLHRALEFEPHGTDTVMPVADLYAELGQIETARQILRRAIDAAETQPDRSSELEKLRDRLQSLTSSP